MEQQKYINGFSGNMIYFYGQLLYMTNEEKVIVNIYAYVILIEYSKYQWRKFARITLWEELFVYFYETLWKNDTRPETERKYERTWINWLSVRHLKYNSKSKFEWRATREYRNR